jgi:hypothetical protein
VNHKPEVEQQLDNIDAAVAFLVAVGVNPTTDAVEQLVEAFIPCLDIIGSRGYHPEGNTWRASGWRGILTDIWKKAHRIWYRSWVNGEFDLDSAQDIINYAGFYIRLGGKEPQWGQWGPPGAIGEPSEGE